MYTYLQETIKGRVPWLTPIINFKIFGVKPVLAFLIRIPFLQSKFLEIDYKVNERVLENTWLYRFLDKLPEGARVLDIGCVSSLIPFEIATMGYKVTGIDIRQYPLSHPNLTFVPADVCMMPFPDASFDLIVAISTIEHIGLPHYGKSFAQGDKKALAEIHRCLKPDGLLYISVPFGKKAIDWQRTYDSKSLEALLEEFDILESKYYQRSQCKFWRPVTCKELEKALPSAKGEVDGVAIVLSRKKIDSKSHK